MTTTPPDDGQRNNRDAQLGEDGTSHGGSNSGESLDVIRVMARELANMLSRPEQPRGRVVNEENRAMVALKKFKKLYPPTFNGMAWPDAAESWLDQIERAFVVMELPEDLKLNIGTYQLVDQAGVLWKNVSSVHRSIKRDEFHSLF